MAKCCYSRRDIFIVSCCQTFGSIIASYCWLQMVPFIVSVPTHHPENLREEVLNSTSFRLTWTPPPSEHHNGMIRGYRVNVTETQTGRAFHFSVQATELVVSNLRPYFLYECRVTAVTVGTGPYSAAIGVRTHEDGKGSPLLICACISYGYQWKYCG